jgi:hypothetical protein
MSTWLEGHVTPILHELTGQSTNGLLQEKAQAIKPISAPVECFGVHQYSSAFGFCFSGFSLAFLRPFESAITA